MSGRSVLLWVVLPFGVLCALALWLTRPAPAPPESSPPPRADGPGAPDLVTPPPPGREPSPPVAPPPRFPSERGSAPFVPPAAPTAEEEDEALVAAASQDPVVREDLRRAMRATRPLLEQCYEDVAERYPEQPTATLRFTVEGQEGEGRLRNGQVVDTSIPDPMFRACLEDSLLDARFPSPRGGARLALTWPLRFRPPTPRGGPASPGEDPTP